jgi:hypothetical protein
MVRSLPRHFTKFEKVHSVRGAIFEHGDRQWFQGSVSGFSGHRRASRQSRALVFGRGTPVRGHGTGTRRGPAGTSRPTLVDGPSAA